jgi:hypothetical protein
MIADGMTPEEILAEHPDLTRDDIHESLLYAAEAVRERELPTFATSGCRRPPTKLSSPAPPQKAGCSSQRTPISAVSWQVQGGQTVSTAYVLGRR